MRSFRTTNLRNRALSAAERTTAPRRDQGAPRDHLLFHVALGGPLVARDVVAVDVGVVVTEDGTKSARSSASRGETRGGPGG